MQSTSNIVNLHEPSRSVASNAERQNSDLDQQTSAEQRIEHRSVASERLFVQITQTDDSDLVGTTLSCLALDASAHGIRFLVESPIPVGSLLDLWVDDKSKPGKFFLTGDVRWTQTVGGEANTVGVRLQEGLATDMEDWKEAHAG